MSRIKNYREMKKDEIDTHPQTGESKSGTILDLYVFRDDPENVVVLGWGTHELIKECSIEFVCRALEENGFITIGSDEG